MTPSPVSYWVAFLIAQNATVLRSPGKYLLSFKVAMFLTCPLSKQRDTG